jgi:hypothetical protein
MLHDSLALTLFETIFGCFGKEIAATIWRIPFYSAELEPVIY